MVPKPMSPRDRSSACQYKILNVNQPRHLCQFQLPLSCAFPADAWVLQAVQGIFVAWLALAFALCDAAGKLKGNDTAIRIRQE